MKNSSKGALIVLFPSVLYAIISTISKALLNDGLSAFFVIGLRYMGAALLWCCLVPQALQHMSWWQKN